MVLPRTRRRSVPGEFSHVASDTHRSRSRNKIQQAIRPAAEMLELRVMLSAVLDPADYASLGTFNPGPGTYTINTTAGTFTGPSTNLSGVDSNGVEVFDFSNVQIGSGVTINASGDLPFAILSQGGMTIAGTIHNDGNTGGSGASGPGAAGGAGGGAGGASSGSLGGNGVGPGAGDAPGGSSMSAAGGGGFGGTGDGGTTAPAGILTNNGSGGSGGGTYGNLDIALQGGSGGGGNNLAQGGGGGGGTELGAVNSLTISGLITANGGDGAADNNADSGAGSGGGILIAAENVSISGTIQANGGNGAGGSFALGNYIGGAYGGGGGGGIVLVQAIYFDQSGSSFSATGGGGGGLDELSSASAGVITLPTPVMTTLSVGSSMNPAFAGPVTFTATVMPPVGSVFDGGGTVQFAINGANFGSPIPVNSSGVASTMPALSPTGSPFAVTANYSGDANFSASMGTLAGGQTISQASTTTTVTTSADPVGTGETVTLTALVTPQVGESFDGGGTVQFAANGVNIGAALTPNSNGLCTLNYVFNTASSSPLTITATYSGDADFSGSTGTLAGGQTVITSGPLNPSSFQSLGIFDPAPGNYTIDTNAGTLTGPSTSISGVADGAVGVEVFDFSSVEIGSGVIIAATGNLPFAILSQGNMSIAGTINNDNGGAGGGAGDNGSAKYGYGVGQGGGESSSSGQGGAGGGGFGGDGAAGGTSADAVAGGTGGGTYGNLAYVLQGGSGGGAVLGVLPSFSATGGGGGGAAELVAGGALTIQSTGLITADGGNGNSVFGGAGGGSGGGVFLDGDSVTLAGTVEANGGNGGDGTSALGGGVGYAGGGGGGGGQVLVRAASFYNLNGTIETNGGANGAEGSDQNSSTGVITIPAAAISSPTPLIYDVPSDGNAHSLTLQLDSADTDLQIIDNGQGVESLPLDDVSAVQIVGAADQSNSLTVDYTNSFFLIPVSFDGGAGGGTNELTVQGAGASNDTYTPGPSPGAGQLDIEVPGLFTFQHLVDAITFTSLSPVFDDNGGSLNVNGTPGNDAITYSAGVNAGDGLVNVDNLEPIEFTDKTSLTINTGFGADAVSLDNPGTPADLTSIVVNGGDPSAGDTLSENGVVGTRDDFIVQPTGDGAGTLSDDNAGLLQVTFSGIGGLNIVGQSGDKDTIQALGTEYDDTFNWTPGPVPGTATITGSSDGLSTSREVPNSAPFTFVPVRYQDILAGTTLGSFLGNGATGGNDTLNINGLLDVGDYFSYDNGSGFDEVQLTAGGVNYENVMWDPSSAASLDVSFNGGKDFNTYEYDLYPNSGGDDSDSSTSYDADGEYLEQNGNPADQLIFNDLELDESARANVQLASDIYITGDSTLDPSVQCGVNNILTYANNVAVDGAANLATGVSYTPLTSEEGVFTSGSMTLDAAAIDGTLTLDPYTSSQGGNYNSGVATVNVSGDQTVIAAGNLRFPTIGVADYLPITLIADDTTNVDINAGDGSDNLIVDSTNAAFPVPIYFNGGVSGTSTLTLQGGEPESDTYTPGPGTRAGTNVLTFSSEDSDVAAATESVSSSNIASLFDYVDGPLTVNGTTGNDTITYSAGIDERDGLVTVNDLQSIEFSNKSILTINTGLGVDTFVDDDPNVPDGMDNSIMVNAGDSNSGDTLIYSASAEEQTDVIPIAQGAGYVGTDGSYLPDIVQYSGFANLQVIGTPGADQRLDIEQNPDGVGSPQFTITPSVTAGAGSIVGWLNEGTDFGTPFTESIQYSGFARDNETPIVFGRVNALVDATIIYNSVPGGGNFVQVSGNPDVHPFGIEEIDDYVSEGSPNQDIAIFANYNSYVFVNLGTGNNDAEFDSRVGSLNTTINGGGLGSTDNLDFENDGGGNVVVDTDGGFISEGSDQPVNEYALSSIYVDANDEPVQVNGTYNTGDVTFSPSDASSGELTFNATTPMISLANVSGDVTLDPGADTGPGPYTVNIDGTPGNDTIVASTDAGADMVQVDSLLAAALVESDVESLDIDGGAGNNNLIVDSSSGAFTVPIIYDGGDGRANLLTLQGGIADSDIYTPGPGAGAGMDVLTFPVAESPDGVESVTFSNLAPVVDSVVGPLSVDAPAGNDSISYGPGTLGATYGEVAVNNLETIQFTNKVALTLNGNTGGDSFILGNAFTPTGLTEIFVSSSAAGQGMDTIDDNAFNTAVPASDVVSTQINLPGQPPVIYSGIGSITISHATDAISVTPAAIAGYTGQALTDVSVGTFTGGPVGAVGTDFYAMINWGDGITSAGTVVGAAGSFVVIGSHTYAADGTFSPVVTIIDSHLDGNTSAGGVPVTVDYNLPINSTIDDTANISLTAPTFTITDFGGPYTGNAYAATGEVLGVNNANLGTPTFAYYLASDTSFTNPLSVPTNPGSYVVVGSYAGNADYSAAKSSPVAFTITQLVPTVSITDAGGPDTGSAYPATGFVLGLNNAVLGTPTLRYYLASDTSLASPLTGAPSAAGSYVVVGSYGGSTDYAAAQSVPVVFTITQASQQGTTTPTPTFTIGVPSGLYTGSAYVATGEVLGQNNANLGTPAFTYYLASDASFSNPLSAPTNAGSYVVVGNYAGGAGYSAAMSSSVPFSITRATPTFSITDSSGPYTGNPFSASGEVIGVNNASLGTPVFIYYLASDTSFSNPLSSVSAVGSYVVVGDYVGSQNYTAAASAPVAFSIEPVNIVLSHVLTPVDTISAGSSTGTISVATFTDADAESLAHYTATIAWGDGHTSTGTIAFSGGVFIVTGSNVYATTGTYSPVVTVRKDALTAQTVTDTHRVVVHVTAHIASDAGAALPGLEGRTSSGTIATFTVVNTANPATDYSATINWGDGSASAAGTIVSLGGGKFEIVGNHVYQQEGAYTITITLKDTFGETALIKTAAQIADAPLELPAGKTLSVTHNTTFTNLVLGTFRDDDASNTSPATYVGTINWGDGSATSAAKFVFTSATANLGSYWNVEGTHKYASKKTYTVTITLHDVDNPGNAIVITAKITAA